MILVVGRNLIGLLLVVGGIVLMIPGVPGPGFLILAIGVTLLDVPGKRRMELRLLQNPRVLRALNRVRARFGRPPLVVTTDPPSAASLTPRAE